MMVYNYNSANNQLHYTETYGTGIHFPFHSVLPLMKVWTYNRSLENVINSSSQNILP